MRSAAFAFLVCCTPSLAFAAEWKSIATALIEDQKPGYGGLSGVLVDSATGTIYVQLSDRGVFRSTDQGKTWVRLSQDGFKGRTETPGCFQIDPTGKTKRLLLPVVYGSPISIASDTGDWRMLDKSTTHVDWCAADWSDPEMKFLLTLKHESGGQLLMSRDGGKSFTDLGKGYGPAWIFDKDTAVVARMKTKDNPKGGLVSTLDGGKTWVPAGDMTPTALPRWGNGGLYWLADGFLFRTGDKGQTWMKLGAIKDARYGPVFGKDERHLFVLTGTGIVESTDGGDKWSAPIAAPAELKGINYLTWLDYDPKKDVLYLMKMTSDLYVMQRGK